MENGQEYLPGMEISERDANAIARKEKIEKGYACRACPNDERSVTWDPSSEVFSCYICGRIDINRTNEIRKLS
jgi:predicted RNA-binding Zn-ribbon protein involved in translation (DUF1610 family)